jgi:type II secretion system protein N
MKGHVLHNFEIGKIFSSVSQNPNAIFLLRIICYIFSFLFFLVFFIYVFFPLNRWKGNIEEIASSYTGKVVTIDKVEGWKFIGLKLKGVRISSKEKVKEKIEDFGTKFRSEKADDTGERIEKKQEKAGAKREDSNGFLIDEMCFRPKIFSFLLGRKGIVFSIEVMGGEVNGEVSIGKKSNFEVDFDDVDLEKAHYFEDVIGLPFSGKVKGEMNLSFKGQKYSEADGEITIKVKEMQIGKTGGKLDLGKAGMGLISGAVKFEPVKVGNFKIGLKGESGVLKVTEMKASSEHLDIEGGGEIKIGQTLSSTRIDLYLKFKFKDAYIQKSAMTRSIFSTLDRITKFRQAKRSDGFWGFAIRGTIAGELKPVPARTGPNGI